MAAFCLFPTFLLRLDFSYWWVRFLYTLHMDILISNHFPSFTCFQVVISGQVCLFLYIRLTRMLLRLVSIKVGKKKKISNYIWFNLNGFLIAFEVTFKEFVLTPRLYKVSQALVCACVRVWLSTVFLILVLKQLHFLVLNDLVPIDFVLIIIFWFSCSSLTPSRVSFRHHLLWESLGLVLMVSVLMGPLGYFSHEIYPVSWD